MNNIEQLEYDVWVLRGQLNELRQQDSNMNDEVYKDRLNRLEFELHYMQQEIERLKGANSLQKVMRQPIPPNKLSGLIPTPITEQTPSNKIIHLPKEKKHLDLEKTFGTGIMGIIASVLVFISIIIFGSLLIPYLSDEIMVLLMFLASFVMAGTGFYLLHKNNENKFYLSLCACGTTAICVSLFVTRIYFGFLNNVLFLFLISVWMAMMAYLCHQYHYLFKVIGEIGILMTCILGITEISFSAEWYSYIVLIFIYGISSLIFHGMKKRETYEKNAFSHITHTIAMIAFSFPIHSLSNELLFMELLIMGALFLLLVILEILIVWNEKVNHGVLFYILSVIQMIILSVNISEVYQTDSSGYIFIFSIFLLYLFSRKQTKMSIIGDICVSFLYLLSSFYLTEDSVWCSIICGIPFLLYGFFRKKKIFLYSGLIGIYSIFFISEITIIAFVLTILLPFILFLFLARKEKDGLFSSIGYGWMLICLSYGISELFYEYDFLYQETITISFIILAISHLLIVKGNLLKNESKIFETSSSIITGIFMITSIPIIYEEYLTVLITLIAIGLFVINSRKLLEKSELFGYYIALKYTVLMLVILDVAWDLAIVYSICMLLFSLLSIIIGFIYNHKSFRIYGLLLSMISVFKLILFDVDGKSMIYNAFGFLICGFICFGISFVYNKIEQKLKNK